jgi:DnaJ-class molecular chaperone
MEETTPNGEPVLQTHYDVLGVSPDDTQDKVHRAYSALLAEFRENPTREMEARVVRARIAHQVLSDPQSRAFYNADLKMAPPPQRKWEYDQPNPEEQRLTFWAGVAALSIPLGPIFSYLFVKGLVRLPRTLARAVGALFSRKRPAEETRER